MSELLWIGQSPVGEHPAQRPKARCGEKEPWESVGGVEADEVARGAAGGSFGWSLRVPVRQARS
jgi:hypothetical protein